MLILLTVFICGVAAVQFWDFFMGVVTADGVGCDKGASARYRGMVAGYTGADYCGHVLFLYHITIFHIDRQVRRPRVVVRSMCSLHCVITTTAHLRSTALHGRCTTADYALCHGNCGGLVAAVVAFDCIDRRESFCRRTSIVKCMESKSKTQIIWW